MSEFSRNDELNQLYHQVMGRENIYLYGSTGIGKSHLLELLTNKLEGRRVCFYRSLRGIISVNQYINEFIVELKRVAKTHSNLDYQLRRFIDENPIYLFETLPQLNTWFTKLTTTLEQVGLDFLFVFEDLHEWELEEDLSNLLEHFKILTKGSNCQITISSNHSFSQNFKPKKYSPFHLEGVKKEIIWQSDSEDWQSWAHNFSRGNTAFLLELIQYLKQSDYDTKAAADRLMQDYHPILSKVRGRFTKLQWNLLRSIAFEEKVEQPHSFDFLVKYKLGAASSVERALKNLSDTQMIIKTDEGWIVSNVAYLRWLQWLYSRLTF